MDENREVNPGGSNEVSGVGGKIKKERLTRRISVDTIAKDLKMSPVYIKAIEENDFDSLPAYAYVRVYLRSIANYLQMDAEKIVHEFLREMGEEAGEPEPAESAQDVTTPGKKSTGIYIILVLLIVLAAGGVIIKTLISDSDRSMESEGDETEITKGVADSSDTISEKVGITASVDSLSEDSVAEESVVNESSKKLIEGDMDNTDQEKNIDTDTLAKEEEETSEKRDKELSLRVRTLKDSVWIHIFIDGDGKQMTFPPGYSRVFKAKDSINICVGRNQSVRYSLNGKNLAIGKKGPVVLKIDDKGVDRWRLKKFNRVFKGR